MSQWNRFSYLYNKVCAVENQGGLWQTVIGPISTTAGSLSVYQTVTSGLTTSSQACSFTSTGAVHACVGSGAASYLGSLSYPASGTAYVETFLPGTSDYEGCIAGVRWY